MNSLVKVFSNFREFYSEINGATLTGAIDVIVVEQPDGEFQCSPFHVRFGKLGVLRSREKVVDIEINGEPVDIHMKLGESGEAFFVEECPEEDVEELPYNLATSPIPTGYFPDKFNNDALEIDNSIEENAKIASDDIQLPIPLPRRNSIDLSTEAEKEENRQKIENQISDFRIRRHTDNSLNRSNLRETVKEYTTQKLRQEWAEHEEIFQFDAIDKDKEWMNSTQTEEAASQTAAQPAGDTTATLDVTLTTEQQPTTKELVDATVNSTNNNEIELNSNNNSIKEESKSKKKRRKKTQMKKKNAQRKSSSSSSIGSNPPLDGVAGNGGGAAGGGGAGAGGSATTINASADDLDTLSVSLSANAASLSNDDSTTTKSLDQVSAPLLSAMNGDESPISEKNCQLTPITPTSTAARIPDLDIHFFSDTEVTSSGGNGPSGSGRGAGRPSTPIQSDSELEISLREKDSDVEMLSTTALWKWGELPTPDHRDAKGGAANGQFAQSQAQAQRNSMLSGMFNFMKKTNKMRKQVTDDGVYLSDLVGEGMDQEMAAMYLPQDALLKERSPLSDGPPVRAISSNAIATANATLPAAGDDDRESGNGTSLPHSPSSMEGQKSVDSDYEDGGKPQDEKYLDFVAMSLCGMSEKGDPSDEEFDRHLIKYPDDVIDQLITNAKQDSAIAVATNTEVDGANAAAGQAKRSWWYWRRSQNAANQVSNSKIAPLKPDDKLDEKDIDQNAVATQTTRPNSPDVSDNTLSKTESTLNAENTSAMVENMEDLSQASSKNGANKNEHFKKSLRLSSEAIKKLNLKNGMNEIEFSVTTAYQGTTRCKCYLFRWKHNDKVVISDIDGTITKSDVLGHILPMVGKDWAQLGVAQLFSKIEKNGYKLLYLSARAIGQSRVTREYLRSIRQGNVKLPDGPLLLNPTSLISAFHREVIERKPEQFKIACLSDIRDLFPDKDPFYAGYGNRINDVWAYRAVGIPIMRIFTINTKGELKHELTQTFQSSGYINQSLEVDEHFPALDEYEYRTDTFDDDEDEAELQFSETTTNNDDDDDEGHDEDLFSDDYADDDDGIGGGPTAAQSSSLIIADRVSASQQYSALSAKNDILASQQRWLVNE